MDTSSNLTKAALITRSASKQTYYTIRFLVDRDRLENAYRAYAYFRWVDDTVDAQAGTGPDGRSFIHRQQSLLERCYEGLRPGDTSSEEEMLVELVQSDREKNSGLQKYLTGIMQIMAFDAGRRGRLISRIELEDYTRLLAEAVTEAMHYFIGHDCISPRDSTRYLAVSAAHITHMLRDAFDDVRAGYFNIPREFVESKHIGPDEVTTSAYRLWIRDRVALARAYFNIGRDYLARVQSVRCRLAGCAYTSRFEWLLDTFEREKYILRPTYPERKAMSTGLRMLWRSFSSIITLRSQETPPLPGSV